MVANFGGRHPETNTAYKIENSYIEKYNDLGLVSSGHRGVNWKAFSDLYQLFQFSQIRWSCQNADGSKSVDIATALTEKGLAVVKRFFDDTPADSCGSFYRLPADKAVLSQSCSHWSSQSWLQTAANVGDDKRLYFSPFYTITASPVGYLAYTFEDEFYSCDGPRFNEAEPGSWWRVYVR